MIVTSCLLSRFFVHMSSLNDRRERQKVAPEPLKMNLWQLTAIHHVNLFHAMGICHIIHRQVRKT